MSHDRPRSPLRHRELNGWLVRFDAVEGTYCGAENISDDWVERYAREYKFAEREHRLQPEHAAYADPKKYAADQANIGVPGGPCVR